MGMGISRPERVRRVVVVKKSGEMMTTAVLVGIYHGKLPRN